jgi:hypothetical protein
MKIVGVAILMIILMQDGNVIRFLQITGKATQRKLDVFFGWFM